MLFSSRKQNDYPDDIFAETRMSFGDHIEELRTHLLRAIYGLLVVLVGGLALDAVGQSLGIDQLGVGRPMLRVIVDPAEAMVREFYQRRAQKSADKIVQARAAATPDPDQVRELRARVAEAGGSTRGLSEQELAILRAAPQEMRVSIPAKAFEDVFGLKPKDPAVTEVTTTMLVNPAEVNYFSEVGQGYLGTKQYLTTLSVQEAFVVYFKVSILCSFVLASPWVFYQVWAFVAAGLYPHEREYVYRFLAPSILLFLTGVLLCQFVVLPGAVKALIGFNDWIDLDPDLRLNEWLGFALLLPIVFGVSFQTPLVMFFLNRIGTFSWEDYWAKWRYAVVILAFFAAIITPTPDAVTMLYLFVPMFGLYMLGVAVCKYFPPEHEAYMAEDEQVAV